MMDHNQRACPRCGEPAGDYRFCQSCRAHMDSLTGSPSAADAHAADPTYLAAQVLQLEQALAAASKGITDRIAGETSTAVQVEPEPHLPDTEPAEIGAVSLDRPTAPDVARLEDVLTVAPPTHDERNAPPTPKPAANEPTQLSAPPVERLEPPASAEHPVAVTLYVAAQALREAFWFEQASAFKPQRSDEEPVSPAPQPVGSEAAPDLQAAESTDPVQSVAPPRADADTSVAEPSGAGMWQGNWLAALCVLALIALVAMLTGRRR